jgi:cytochrome bd-type quinol oxidase subunit 2
VHVAGLLHNRIHSTGICFNKNLNFIQATNKKLFMMLNRSFLCVLSILQFASLALGKSKSSRKKTKTSSGGIAGIVVAVFFVVLVILFILWWKRKKNHKHTNIVDTPPSSGPSLADSARVGGGVV